MASFKKQAFKNFSSLSASILSSSSALQLIRRNKDLKKKRASLSYYFLLTDFCQNFIKENLTVLARTTVIVQLYRMLKCVFFSSGRNTGTLGDSSSSLQSNAPKKKAKNIKSFNGPANLLFACENKQLIIEQVNNEFLIENLIRIRIETRKQYQYLDRTTNQRMSNRKK